MTHRRRMEHHDVVNVLRISEQLRQPVQIRITIIHHLDLLRYRIERIFLGDREIEKSAECSVVLIIPLVIEVTIRMFADHETLGAPVKDINIHIILAYHIIDRISESSRRVAENHRMRTLRIVDLAQDRPKFTVARIILRESFKRLHVKPCREFPRCLVK